IRVEVVLKGASIKAMGIMDAWKGGRIIYAYLIWVVFKAATAGGLYGEYTSDLSSSRIHGTRLLSNACFDKLGEVLGLSEGVCINIVHI
ncbi:Uncharacterized protein DBV15_05390, partial [Temnothorax longispinosus]